MNIQSNLTLTTTVDGASVVSLKTLATRSESVIENYRRDLEEFGTGLKKEIEVAQGSLGTVGHAIDELGNTVLKGTTEIIAQVQRLKTSLSESLSRFYPLENNCNNEGVVFSEARTDLLLSDFLGNLNIDVMGEFFSQNEEGESPVTWPLMKVKVSFFGSGSGFAVCVGISHKISDGPSLLSFVQGWAATAKDVAVTTPTFAGTTIYPPNPSSSQPPPTIVDTLVYGGNRFVFESSKITELKHKAASESVMVPTRVEAITSLIWSKCFHNSSLA